MIVLSIIPEISKNPISEIAQSRHTLKSNLSVSSSASHTDVSLPLNAMWESLQTTLHKL
jgi:hypothetical protein